MLETIIFIAGFLLGFAVKKAYKKIQIREAYNAGFDAGVNYCQTIELEE